MSKLRKREDGQVSAPAVEQVSASRQPKRWKMVLTWLVVIVATPATVAISSYIGSRSYIVASILIVFYTMIPFFVQFEQRRPQARELVVIAVLVAIAVASRAAFAFLPSFKPVAGIVMIAAIALGGSSGFLVGSLAMLTSNFIFGQGPWTPWQMLAFGLAGFVFGFLADRGIIKRDDWSMGQRFAVSLGGALFVFCILGPLLDTSSLFWMIGNVSAQSAIAVYAAGAPMNAVHAAATFVTIFLVGNPILGKLSRIKVKYGMME